MEQRSLSKPELEQPDSIVSRHFQSSLEGELLTLIRLLRGYLLSMVLRSQPG